MPKARGGEGDPIEADPVYWHFLPGVPTSPYGFYPDGGKFTVTGFTGQLNVLASLLSVTFYDRSLTDGSKLIGPFTLPIEDAVTDCPKPTP